MLTHIWQRTLVWRSWDPNKISAKKLKARKKQAEVWFDKVTQPEGERGCDSEGPALRPLRCPSGGLERDWAEGSPEAMVEAAFTP